ncbi:MAG: hypothetical protein HY716_13760 [Planctomycetes bacterium]|nr:hypothetical protein [Planctomycetota bacterium]
MSRRTLLAVVTLVSALAVFGCSSGPESDAPEATNGREQAILQELKREIEPLETQLWQIEAERLAIGDQPDSEEKTARLAELDKMEESLKERRQVLQRDIQTLEARLQKDGEAELAKAAADDALAQMMEEPPAAKDEEAAKKAEEEEAKREEEARRAEEARKAEEEARAAEEEARKGEEARLAEARRKEEEARRTEEEALRAEEARRAEEEARRMEEAKKAAEAEKTQRPAQPVFRRIFEDHWAAEILKVRRLLRQ